jgi:hypothetical protein
LVDKAMAGFENTVSNFERSSIVAKTPTASYRIEKSFMKGRNSHSHPKLQQSSP